MRYIFALTALLAGGILYAQPNLEFVNPIGGFTRPVDITGSGDGSNRLFVVEQTGRIKMIRDVNGTPVVTDYLDLNNKFVCCNERGVLGLTFDPDFASNGHLYVNYSSNGSGGYPFGATVVARFTAASAGASSVNVNTEVVVDTIHQPFGNHNGGDLAFGPDGMLYVPMGDGGSGGDPREYSQNLGSKLGKLLRYDVRNLTTNYGYAIPANNPYADPNDGIPDMIFASGLRNPWRASFDAAGNYWMADVGQGAREEVSVLPAGTNGGQNFGWDCEEGFIPYTGDASAVDCDAVGPFVDPVFDYGRSSTTGGRSITGGFVYRGSAGDLTGYYVAADYISNNFFLLPPAGTAGSVVLQDDAPLQAVSTFGEGDDGELYVAELNRGIIHRVTTTVALPVNLTSWTATVLGKNVELKWATAAESGAADYLLERSTDGTTFRAVATVAAANDPEGATYRYVDEAPGSGSFLYRLTQRDVNGSSRAYGLRRVFLGAEAAPGPVLSPNPGDGDFVLSIPELQFGGAVGIRVSDSAGRLVYRRDMLLEAGPQQTRHRLPEVAAGIYQIQISYEGQQFVRRLIVR